MESIPVPPDSDRNFGPNILAVTWVECSVALLLVILRYYTRKKVIKNVGWDDYMIFWTMLLSSITSVVVTLEVHYGVGRHWYYLTNDQRSNAVKWIWLSQPFSSWSAGFGKVSVALLLQRLMNRNRPQELMIWFTIASLLIVNLACTIITFAQCAPVQALWNRAIPGSHCWDPVIQQNAGYFQSAYSSFTDLFLALFPIVIVWDLQMKLRIKIGIAGIMAFGVLATIAAIVKTIELKNLTASDFTWSSINLIYWFTTENYSIIIAACIPTLRPLFQRRFRKPNTSFAKNLQHSDAEKVRLKLNSTGASGNC